MDVENAKSLANQMQISIDSVVREEYEILLLKELFEGEFGSSLVFKGGTALRLVYGSPRFSEDLDFTGIAVINYAKFAPFLERVGKRYPGIVRIETREKFYTLFALVKIKEDYLSRAMTIKIEISKRMGNLEIERDYTDKLISSPVTPLTVLARVATLERILHEKEDALKNRKAARDVFDYWYINQRLNQGEAKPDLKGFSKIQVKDELHRLLPRNYWRLVDLWLE
jgi:predicted nucleotidyltransferase component of viral defense system